MMISKSNLKRRISVYWPDKTLPLLSLILGITITFLIAFYDHQIIQDNHKELANERLYRLKSELERAFYSRLSITSALTAFTKTYANIDLNNHTQFESFRKKFEHFTKSLDNQIQGVLSMQLAPDAVVTFVTNPERNRKAIGHDLLVDDARRDQVLITIERRSQIVAGPLSLIQGGEAVIVRQAIFTKPGAFSSERYMAQGRAKNNEAWLHRIPKDFWGLSTVLIDTKTLYKEAGLNNPDDRFQFAIRGRHGSGADGEVFWGDEMVFNNPLATTSIALPDGKWFVGIDGAQPLIIWRLLIIILTGLTGTSLLVYAMLSQRDKIEAIASNHAKSEFLSIMSHEMRTPMHAILSYSELGNNKTSTASREKIQQYFSRIHLSGNRLLLLLNNLLDLSKIEAGKMEYNFQQHDLSIDIDIAVTELEELIRQKQLRLDLQPAVVDTIATFDHEKILQVVRNLLSNAIKFSQKGKSIKLSFDETELHTKNGLVLALSFSISDEGIGIPIKELDTVFDKFIQSSKTKMVAGGTGLGLAICKEIIEGHEGIISAINNPQGGADFTFTIPRQPFKKNQA